VKRRGKGKWTSKHPEVDFPIASFADSLDRVFGMKKSQSGNVKEMAKAIQEEDVPDDWGDREEVEKETDERVVLTIVQEKLWVPKKKYRLLPIDFWHLLGGYIPPEKVGVFAMLCRASYSVTCSHSFWKGLYLRHFNPLLHSDLLPDRLLPSTLLHRPRGLRSCVIRALHIMYPGFQGESPLRGIWPDPRKLVGSYCSIHWTRRVAMKQVFFFFKLREKCAGNLWRKNRGGGKEGQDCDNFDDTDEINEDFLEELSDIQYNPEEGCHVLQVGAAAWAQLPPVMGLQLRSVGLSVSGMGMRFHKLSLEFGTGLQVTHLVLEPVTSMKVGLVTMMVLALLCRCCHGGAPPTLWRGREPLLGHPHYSGTNGTIYPSAGLNYNKIYLY